MLIFFKQIPTILWIPFGWCMAIIILLLPLRYLWKKKIRFSYAVSAILLGLAIFSIWLFTISPPTIEKPFLRIIYKDGEYLFQTARCSYKNEKTDDVVVLQGICHIGEKDLYMDMESYFADFENILFEGVVPVSHSKKKTKKNHIDKALEKIVSMYDPAAEALDLVTQQDYMPQDSRWVWCDVTSLELENEMKRRKINIKADKKDEDLKQINVYSLLELLSHSNIYGQACIISYGARHSFDIVYIKRMLEAEGSDEEKKNADYKKLNSIIVDFRNRRAISKLKQFLRNPASQHIALFYGAAHLPGMEQLLLQDGFKRSGDKMWTTIWRF